MRAEDTMMLIMLAMLTGQKAFNIEGTNSHQYSRCQIMKIDLWNVCAMLLCNVIKYRQMRRIDESQINSLRY